MEEESDVLEVSQDPQNLDAEKDQEVSAPPKKKRRKAGEKWRQANEGKEIARPVRETCKIARDHIYANLLQQQFSFRAYGALPAAPKARKATKAASVISDESPPLKADKGGRKQKKSPEKVADKKQNGKMKLHTQSGTKPSSGARQIEKAKDESIAKRKQPSKPAATAARKFADNNSSPRSPEKSTPCKKGLRADFDRRSAGSARSTADAKRSGSKQPNVVTGKRNRERECLRAETMSHRNVESERANRKDDTGEEELTSAQSSELRREPKAESETNPVSVKREPKNHEDALSRLKKRFQMKKELMIRNVIERTRKAAETGMKSHEWKGEKKGVTIPFMLCPAEDGHPYLTPDSHVGKLMRAKLAAPPEATVLHLKKFLQGKLSLGGSVQSVEIACRGFALPDHQTLYAIKNYLWPQNHHMDPILRFRKIPGQRPLPLEAQSKQSRMDLFATMFEERTRKAKANPTSNFHKLMQPVPLVETPKISPKVEEEEDAKSFHPGEGNADLSATSARGAPKPYIPPDEDTSPAMPPVGPNAHMFEREGEQPLKS